MLSKFDIKPDEIETWRIMRELEENKKEPWYSTSLARYSGHLISISEGEIEIRHELREEDQWYIDYSYVSWDGRFDDWCLRLKIYEPSELKEFDLWKLCEESLQKYSAESKEDMEDAKDEIAAKIAEILFAELPNLVELDEFCSDPTVFHKKTGE